VTAVPRLAKDVAAALAGCVRGGPVAGLATVPLDELADGARRHGVSGFAWRAVRAAGLAGSGADALRTDVAIAAGRHLRALADLELIAGALDVPWLVFKGPVLAELVHDSPALRSYTDVDVLVAPAGFAAAVAALEAAGCVVFERNWSLVRAARLGSLRLHTPTGTLIDLHWHLLNDAADRAAFEVDCAAVLARRRSVRLTGLDVPAMDPVDQLVHLALHAALAGANRLVWLADLHAAAATAYWPLVLRRAAEWSAGPPLATVLHRCATVLDTPVPPLTDIPGVGRSWLAVCAAADRLSDVTRWSGGRSLAVTVAKAARADDHRSHRALLRRALASLHGSAPDTQALFDPHDTRSVSHPTGGAPERAAYLAEVAHQ
jgi:putative nucleotidyltransferase-like protein